MTADAMYNQSLRELSDAIRASLGNSTHFQLLNTRLIIQLGVNLKNISDAQDRDEALLRSVYGALKRMGIQAGRASK